jgi:chorismate mutase / prephenate dehydrogenase
MMFERIGIVGGSGQMGRMFADAFRASGRSVVTTDADTIHKERWLVQDSDVIVVSVPIDVTVTVIRRLRPWLHSTQLLTDFSSVKSGTIPALLETDAAVISCHPMFGSMPDFSSQNVILLPARPGKFLAGFQRLFREIGLNVVVMDDWKKHDEYMSFIQGLMHFFHIVFTQTLRKKGADLATLMAICSPVYQANFAFTCRILQRDPHLYTHILMDNPANAAVLSSFIDEAKEGLKLIQKKNDVVFMDRFLENRAFLGRFAETFSRQSDFLVEKLKEFSSP